MCVLVLRGLCTPPASQLPVHPCCPTLPAPTPTYSNKKEKKKKKRKKKKRGEETKRSHTLDRVQTVSQKILDYRSADSRLTAESSQRAPLNSDN